MLRKLILGLVAVLAIAAPIALVSAPAEAASNKPCITKSEFGNVHRGQSMQRVAQVVDSRGFMYFYEPSPGPYAPVTQGREHRQCGSHKAAWIDYKRVRGVWLVAAKYWG